MSGAQEFIDKGDICKQCSAYIGIGKGEPRLCFACESYDRHHKFKLERLKQKKKK